MPFVFPLVGGMLYFSYNTLTDIIYNILMNTNKFVSFVTQGNHEAAGLSGEWRVISILFVIWLGIMLLSYTLKFVEYLVFKLQV